MRKTLAFLSLSLGIALLNPLWSAVAQVPNLLPLPIPTTPDLSPIPIPITPEITPPLKPIAIGSDCMLRQTCLGWDDQIWGRTGASLTGGDRKALLASIDNSLLYLTKGDAIAAYQNYPVKEITLDRVRRSLLRFRQLVVSSKSADQLQAAVRREFVFYQSVGNDGKGTVKFTAYYEPVYTASRVRTAIYKYPLYRLPPDFSQWPKPHPKRVDLEGKDGLKGNKSKLHGLELLWFRDRLDAYMVHIQGSAQIKLTNGKTTSIGYAGGTDYPWTSIGKELAKDGKMPLNGLTLPRMIAYFRQKPHELSNYLPRWERFIFFQETGGAGATGSIHVPVTAERSIATDKSLMPPGALALIYNSFPYAAPRGKLENRTVSRFVLDQDTGSAIKGPGRVDYFMGSGKLAGDRAGITGGNGSLYYLLLKD
ncbi:murein transglycosylase A [Nostoc sp. 'Peltigera membranacea cyanobiont' 232]|uniref:murein transglycosylase A n=1 Tax=Nostoc sp. 'Peltigera membranacea cyanobiont' 232 TaxID=2014531 RepID=UPI000B9552F1|nr:murein transglycosylase A [Nostoc sp. 'Peltigera membranacea cyanobiont' 232]OYE02542.1 murein transglycosylase [Nostoc sp. 'Peltigera membranacea cyanobiont' 232]